MIHSTPTSSAAFLADAARQLLPKSVGVATTDPRFQTGEVLPAEAIAMAAMAPKRRREFTAGRLAARGAMAEVGHFGHPVPMDADRTPIWPQGLVGSISHTTSSAIALAADDRNFSSLAVDLEPDAPLDPTLFEEILTAREIRFLRACPAEKRGRLARLIFSAKECAYKCQYPLTRKLFGFDGFEIRLDQDKEIFDARFTQPVGNFAKDHILGGRYFIGNGLILTTMALAATGTCWKGE
ncbi:MAG: 4'-phosphopantetheinyl transferase superfamily protein [Rhodobacteraceae bacterium]|nr:4'-phosphopantetheinyl transferase superfamily protein [Paracoccaceae bacterium]